MSDPSTDFWDVVSTTRTIRRFTTEPVSDSILTRCLQAATWAPSGANAQGWRFIVLRSPAQRAVVAQAAARAMEVIEPVYGMTRPGADDDSRRARTNRATYELHDRAGEFTSVLFTQQRYPSASELLLGGSIFPAMQNFLLAARALGLGACVTSWASYGGEQLLRAGSGRARRVDAGRTRRHRLAPGPTRPCPPPPPRRGGVPRCLGRSCGRHHQQRVVPCSGRRFVPAVERHTASGTDP